jgi:hypothetical protein
MVDAPVLIFQAPNGAGQSECPLSAAARSSRVRIALISGKLCNTNRGASAGVSSGHGLFAEVGAMLSISSLE